MIDYTKEVGSLIARIETSKIKIIDKLHYSKYSFMVNSNFHELERFVSTQVRKRNMSLVDYTNSLTKDAEKLYGSKWKDFCTKDANIHNIKFKPDEYDYFIKSISFLKNANIKISDLHRWNVPTYMWPIVTISIPSDSDHLKTLIDLQEKTNKATSFTNIKYVTTKPKLPDYPVKSVVSFNMSKLTNDDRNYVWETIEDTDGIFATCKSLKRKMLNSRYPFTTTIYSKSPDCFNHLVFMLKPYNIKFVSTEVSVDV
jgi:hypothetical protein